MNGTFIVKRMMIWAIIFGKICRKITSLLGAPRATAELIYMSSLTPITRLLIILVLPIPFEIPKTMITCHKLGPIIDMISIKISKPGILNSASINLCNIKSNVPPI